MSVNKANRIGGLSDADAQEKGQGDRDDEDLDAWRTATRHVPSHANTRAVSSCREQSRACRQLLQGLHVKRVKIRKGVVKRVYL